MKRNTFMLAAVLATLSFVSCNSDDDDTSWNNVPAQVRTAFVAKYPLAQNIEWADKGDYKVAEFTSNHVETSAWFDANGVWYMTETDLAYNALPAKVKDAFSTSAYATWRVDDVDMLERKDSETMYIIELELQNKEVDLYYSTEGVLIKAVVDSDNSDYQSHIPQPIATDIKAFINQQYPGATVMEIETENGRIEVDIIHNNIGKEVVFDTANKWIHTSWDIRTYDLPEVVKGVVAKHEVYSAYVIDDADFFETAQGTYYLLELEKGSSEIKIKVDPNGNILS